MNHLQRGDVTLLRALKLAKLQFARHRPRVAKPPGQSAKGKKRADEVNRNGRIEPQRILKTISPPIRMILRSYDSRRVRRPPVTFSR